MRAPFVGLPRQAVFLQGAPMPFNRLLAVIFILTIMSASTSKPSSWTKTKFPGQVAVSALAACNNTVLVGTVNGALYRSTDNGATWTMPPSNSDAVFCFFVKGAQVFAGSRGKILQSGDCGKSWKTFRTPRDMDTIASLVTFNNFLFAVEFHRDRPERVFRTINPLPLADYGQWNIFTNGALPLSPHGLLLAANNQRVFLGTTNHGIFISAGGLERTLLSGGPTPIYSHIPGPWLRAWDKGAYGLPSPNEAAVRGLAVCGQAIFAITETGVFRSEGLGVTWKKASGSLPQNAGVTAFCAAGSNTLFCATQEGIYCGRDRYNNAASTQQFVDWTALPKDGLPRDALAPGISHLAVCGGYLFAVIPNQGIYRW
jgi:hypothetical protein